MTFPDEQQHADDARATETSLLTLDAGDIHVCRDGPHDAPVLLLIHGSASSTRSWDPLVPLLTTSHHVVRVDLLGHGRSTEAANHSYEIPLQARRVGVALDRLDVGRTTVVGHSSGGAVATALAEQRPDLVTALVLINTGPSLDAFLATGSAAIEPSQWPPADEFIRQFASTGFSRTGYQVPQELVDDVRAMTHHAFTATMQATSVYLQQQTLPERLRALDTPLHVIFGDQDRRWRPLSAGDYRAVPGARVEFLSGIGHSPILEDPPRTAALLLAFTAARAARAD